MVCSKIPTVLTGTRPGYEFKAIETLYFAGRITYNHWISDSALLPKL